MNKRWDVIISLFQKDKEIVGAEIGVLRGETSCRVLAALPMARLYMVDRWSIYPNDEREPVECNKMPSQDQAYFDKALRLAVQAVKPFHGRYKILKMESAAAAEEVKEKLDFVFLDARHDYEGVKRDISIWKKKVKKGGFIMGHDYGNANHPGVKKAVDEAFEEVAVLDDNVWVVRK